jgi:hypothetical protein
LKYFSKNLNVLDQGQYLPSFAKTPAPKTCLYRSRNLGGEVRFKLGKDRNFDYKWLFKPKLAAIKLKSVAI